MKALMYTKRIHDSKHNKDFDKILLSYKGNTFECALWEDVESNLKAEMKTKGLNFPIDIDFTDEQIYFKQKKYTRNDHSEGVKYKVYFKGFNNIEQGKFVSKPLDSILVSKPE